MDTALLKKEMTEKISSISNPTILERLNLIVEDFALEDEGKDFWDTLPDQLKKTIKKAEQELNEGKGVPHEKVMADIKARYKFSE